MSKEKYPLKLTGREYQLIKFIREEMRFGKVCLVIHAGRPKKVIIKDPEKHFDGVVDKEKNNN